MVIKFIDLFKIAIQSVSKNISEWPNIIEILVQRLKKINPRLLDYHLLGLILFKINMKYHNVTFLIILFFLIKRYIVQFSIKKMHIPLLQYCSMQFKVFLMKQDIFRWALMGHVGCADKLGHQTHHLQLH